jgi:cell division protease FtsH
VLLIVAAVLIYMYVKYGTEDADQKMFNYYKDNAEIESYELFLQDASNGMIDTVYYNTGEEYMVFTLLNEDTRSLTREQRDAYVYDADQYRRTIYPAGEQFRQNMVMLGVNLKLIRNNTTNTLLLQTIISALPLTMLAIFWIWAMKNNELIGGGDLTAEKIIQRSNVSFDDIIGLDELRDELNLITKLIKDRSYGKELGVRLPKGILLSGSPGVGKTMIAKAISKEAGVNFISVAASDFQELFVGNGARHIRKIFKIARENAPCIVFIDEIDAVGVARNKRGSSSEDNQTINALLKEMDGFKENEDIFVLAATNNPDQLDEAIKRSGRFDREIIIPTPRTWEVRRDMFKHYLKDKPVSDDVDLETISRQTVGFTGADIAMICNEAGIIALAEGYNVITHECIVEAVDKKIFKGSKSRLKVNESDRRIVAYHEAGHAVMSLLCKEPVARASIKSTTSGVGGAVFSEDKETQFITKKDMIKKVMVAYAGRASEKVKFDEVTTGASNDITQATQIILQYVCKYGFCDNYGLLDYDVLLDSGTIHSSVAEKYASKLSKKIYDETLRLVEENKDTIELLALKLMEVESMSGTQIKEFLAKEIGTKR